MRTMNGAAVLTVMTLAVTACSKEMPNLELQDPFGEQLELATLGEEYDHTVLVILVGSCPMTMMGLRILKDFHETQPPFTKVAGVLVDASPDRASAFMRDHDLPFTVYGLDRRKDPLGWNELVRNVGSKRRALFGGTIVVVDHNLRIRYSADTDDLRKAPDRLARLTN